MKIRLAQIGPPFGQAMQYLGELFPAIDDWVFDKLVLERVGDDVRYIYVVQFARRGQALINSPIGALQVVVLMDGKASRCQKVRNKEAKIPDL